MATAQNLWLDSASLFSKWGFNDGDEPEWLWDYCQEQGLDWGAVDWRAILRQLVRAYLLPALAECHRVEVEDIETHHNPIRASTIDGQKIDENAGQDTAPQLTPDGVSVPTEVVVAEVRAALNMPHPQPSLP